MPPRLRPMRIVTNRGHAFGTGAAKTARAAPATLAEPRTGCPGGWGYQGGPPTVFRQTKRTIPFGSRVAGFCEHALACFASVANTLSCVRRGEGVREVHENGHTRSHWSHTRSH